MNRIDKLFAEKKGDILSIYFCAGAPKFDATVPVLKSLEAHGVNMVEIGIPFSDPMADGPVIQDASTKALRGGMTLRKLFAQLQDVRKEVSMPLLLMGYLNPVMQYGFEAFCAKCQEVGIDGVIIPDLPFADYMRDFKPLEQKYNVKFIMLITPETSDERVMQIDANTDGFIYMVSSAATTGAQKSFDEQKQAYFKKINAMNLKNPRMIGFGISNAETYSAAVRNAAGAIIGSRFVTLLDEAEGDADKAITTLLGQIGKLA